MKKRGVIFEIVTDSEIKVYSLSVEAIKGDSISLVKATVRIVRLTTKAVKLTNGERLES